MAGEATERILLEGVRPESHFTVVGVVRTIVHFAPNHQPTEGQLEEIDSVLAQVIGDLQHVRDHIKRQRHSD